MDSKGINDPSFFQLALESSSTGIIAIDKEENIILINHAVENMLGVNASHLLHKPFSKLLEITGNSDSILLSTLRNSTEYEHVEAVIESRSGPINVMAYTNLIYNGQGEILGALLYLRDITPQKQLEEQMFQARKFYAIGELAAGIAHEVRNPLTSVKGFLQLFDNQLKEKHPQKKYINIMLKEIERATGIINQFLLLSKPVLPLKKYIDIHQVIDEVIMILRGEAEIQKVECVTRPDPNLPFVNADEEQIKQVLINIAHNALYSMPEGGTLTFETYYELGLNKVHIVVTDTGLGMESIVLEKVFDPFFTTKAEGTGLGLTVSQKIIYNHGGRIEAQSTKGAGSTFRIILPVHDIPMGGLT